MEDLLDAVEPGQAARVQLAEGQCAWAAGGHQPGGHRQGMSVETLEADEFVAVPRAAEPKTRQGRQPSPEGGQRRRARPRKYQARDEAEIASQRDLASGES
jgi:hypothetical protein